MFNQWILFLDCEQHNCTARLHGACRTFGPELFSARNAFLDCAECHAADALLKQRDELAATIRTRVAPADLADALDCSRQWKAHYPYGTTAGSGPAYTAFLSVWSILGKFEAAARVAASPKPSKDEDDLARRDTRYSSDVSSPPQPPNGDK